MDSLVGLSRHARIRTIDRSAWTGHTTTLLRACLAPALAIALTSTKSLASDIFVDSRNSGKESGTETQPYRTVTSAVSAARAGDQIKIAQGTYAESLRLAKSLTLQGGYSGANAEQYSSGAAGDFGESDPANRNTILRGDGKTPVVTADGTIETVIDGLVITGGERGIDAVGYPESNARLVVRRSRIENNGNPKVMGGGVRAKAELLVEDTTVRGNQGDRGSGIASGPARTILVRSVIEGNVSHGDHGGGLYAVGLVDVIGCVFRNNVVGKTAGYGWGGGFIFYNQGTKASVVDTEVLGNFAPTKGSGVFVDDGAEAILRNVLIADNRCAKEGGALYVDGDTSGHGSKVQLINVTIAGHNCEDTGYGHAIVMERDSVVDVASSILWNNGKQEITVSPGNKLAIRYSNTKNQVAGDGNTSLDPQFVDPNKGDYRLRNALGRRDFASKQCVKDKASSPLIDKGDPQGQFEREPDPNGGRGDMGAYGNSPLSGCSTQESLAESLPMTGAIVPSLGPSKSGRARCGCEVPGVGALSVSKRFVVILATWAGLRLRRNATAKRRLGSA